MELIIKDMQLPESIEFNFEELKQELAEKVSFYEGLVYTEEQVKDAKSDRAKLNKLKKALNDERIRREREYMEPFMDFKAKVNEIIAIIDKPVAMIDEQVKEFEARQKAQKMEAIEDAFFHYVNSDNHGLRDLERLDFLTLEMIMNQKWLNSSVSIQSINEEIEGIIQRILIDLSTLESLPEFGFEAVQVYKETLDISKAISEGKKIAEMQKAKEMQTLTPAKEIAEEIAEEVAEEEQEGFIPSFDSTQAVWRSYRMKLTTNQKHILEQFLVSSGIVFQEGSEQ